MHEHATSNPGRGPEPAALAALVQAHVLDAELAGLLWLLAEARTPFIVAGPPGSGRSAVADALAAVLPAAAAVLPVGGDGEDFAWLPEAESLGWRTDAIAAGGSSGRTGNPATGVLLAYDLADDDAGGPVGGQALIVVRALALGYGLIATMPADSLDAVLDRLHDPAVGADQDERSRLGVVLVMAAPDAARGPRVAAAHYVRPVALDTHGHVQRLPPAALATWNAAVDRWDHFAWGVLPDLGGRLGLRPIEVEREQARRAAALAAAHRS